MIVLFALLGLLVGAFINLCADQLPRSRRLTGPPGCPVCSRPRPWWAWISISAFLSFRPRCRQCGTPISWRHPITELVAALLFAFIWQRYGLTVYLLLDTVYSAVFLLVVVVDLEHRLILNVVIFPAWALALLGSFLRPEPAYFWRLALLGFGLGFGILFLIFKFGELFVSVMSKARGKPVNAVAFGYGDVRLGGFMGLVLGFPGILLALFLGVLLGGVGGFLYWFFRAVVRRRYSLFTAIPYGPFLVAGAMAMLFFAPEITRWWMGG
jgi:leader peptidase (prepilin peptidase) / N-methyltransferase